jgi:hypothetical protein
MADPLDRRAALRGTAASRGAAVEVIFCMNFSLSFGKGEPGATELRDARLKVIG